MSYADAATLQAWAPTEADEDTVELALSAASAAVDRAAGRTFTAALPTAQARWYTAGYSATPNCGSWVVDVDDLMTDEDLVVEIDGQEVTDYTLLPLNAAAKLAPWTSIEVPTGGRVKVTAKWGWTSVPKAIVLATMIQASRLLARRDSPEGPLSRRDVDDVSLIWSAGVDLDPDVMATVAPYKRRWVAA